MAGDKPAPSARKPASKPAAPAKNPVKTPVKTSAKGARRRGELTAVAARLFAAKGFDATSLQDIADAAGMTKAAVYYHFPDKARLYEAVVVSRLAETYACVISAVDLETEPLARLRAFMLACAGRIDRDRISWVAHTNQFWSLEREQRSEAIIAARDRLETLLREIIREGVSAGALRPADPAMLGRLLLAALTHIPRWHDPKGRLAAADVAALYLDMVLDGVRADG